MDIKKSFLVSVAAFAACALSAQSVKVSDWGKTKDGVSVKIWTLKNANGITAKITDYGAIITELHLPDRNNNFADVVLGFDNVSDYENFSDYFGAVVGRYGNRISNAEFSIDGKKYALEKNNNSNTLHGGFKGFDKRVWRGEASADNNAAVAKFALVSPDGDGGFPGELNVEVVYTLNNKNELVVNYRATTDKATVCNLTQHSYFNLMGAGNGNILNHELTIFADKITPVDEFLIPTGKFRDVAGTPFDFRRPKTVGSRIEADDEQLAFGGGYDHNWVLNKRASGEMSLAARLYEPVSGRQLEVFTEEPGVQFYCGNFLANQVGKNGKVYRYRYGMCLETQHFPDSPNRPNFPSTLLRAGETYNTTTIFKFSVQ